jgi:phosphoglycolate phosphatase-like HAD superfamily hydrolase
MAYDAVVFDNDGVLTRLTDWELVRQSIRDTFAEFGAEASDDHVEDVLRATPERVRRVAGEHGLDPETLWRRREANAAAVQREAMLAGDKPLYDDFDALRALREDHGLDLGVVSNNQHETVEHVLDVHGVGDLFSTAYGREPTLSGITRKKPDPHYLDRALSDLRAEEALYVGDSGSDVEAAHNAGVDSAFVRREHRAEYDLSVDPTHEIASLHDLRDLV